MGARGLEKVPPVCLDMYVPYIHQTAQTYSWEAITALSSLNEEGVSAALAMLAGLSTQANYVKEGSKD